jgi:hypothetical protein
VEANEVDLLAAAVFGFLEQVEDAEKTGFTRQFGSDIGEADGLDRVHFDFAFLHAVAATRFYVGTLPDADAACDVSTTNPVAKAW